MAGLQRGTNAGISGEIQITGTPKFWLKARRYRKNLTAASVPVTRRGDLWKRIRQSTPGGFVSITGEVQADGYPWPTNIKGATGTITVQVHAGVTIPLSVTFVEVDADYSDTRDDVLKVTVTAEITANPGLTGFGGTQATVSTDEAYAANAVGPGHTKGVDPDGLQDNDGRTYNIVGLTDSDSDETNRILSIISGAVVTRTGLKVRRGDFTRVDAWSGNLSLTFARTTTAEDAENAQTRVVTDPTGLNSSEVKALVFDVAAPPSDPPLPDGLKLVDYYDAPFNDDKSIRVWRYAKNDAKDEIEFAGTIDQDDPQDLADLKTVRSVTDSQTSPSPSPPSGYKHRETSRQQRTADGKWIHTLTYARNDTKDEIELEGTFDETDPSGVSGEETDTFLTGSSTAPAASPPSGLVLFRTISRPRTSAGKYVHRHVYRPVTEGQRILNEATRSSFDIEQSQTHEVAEFVNPADYTPSTAAQIAVTEGASRYNSVYFKSLRVNVLTPTKAVVVEETVSNDVIVYTQVLEAGRVPCRARLESGSVQVFMSTKKTRGTGLYLVEIVPQWRHVVREVVNIRRRKNVTPVQSYDTLIATKNQASFLGRAAGTCTFIGAPHRANYSLSPVPAWMDYRVLFDSEGQFSEDGIAMGWFDTTADLSGVSEGWVDASLFGWDAAPLDDGNFSVLIA